ncbi:MAG TPA: enoyl-CoA hydratase/isomerase family protein [Alphaproteobacteria bacterium]|nr:enoyl-CoA hydratase/isomerase family protein [Alphaproteobacteria bacterium]
MAEPIQITTEGAVATVTLDRPAKKNALDLATWRALAAAFQAFDADPALRCVVLRGAGGHFSAGADIDEFETLRATPAQAAQYAETPWAALRALRGCRHPVVAALEGFCIGAGLELALFADIRLAAADCRLGIPAHRRGLSMTPLTLEALIAAIGRPAALELLLEGAVWDAGTAAARGLVNRVAADLPAELAATAARIAAGAPLSNRWHKAMAWRLSDSAPLDEAEQAGSFAIYGSADYAEATRAFAERRAPVFRGE